MGKKVPFFPNVQLKLNVHRDPTLKKECAGVRAHFKQVCGHT